jgi:hypothetical protein
MPFSILRRVLQRWRYAGVAPAGSISIERIGWAVLAVARRFPVGLTCLAEALAADAMLRGHGFAPRLRFGVRPPRAEYARIEAHAWVECEERIVVGRLDDLAEYTVLAAPNFS